MVYGFWRELWFAAEEKPHHRWMAASVAEATYEQQEFEQYEAIAQAEMKAHRL
jgi:hypothetical protein